MANAEKLKRILAAGVLTSSLLTGCGTGNNSESPKGCQVGTGNIEPGKGITVTVGKEERWANCIQLPDGNYKLMIPNLTTRESQSPSTPDITTPTVTLEIPATPQATPTPEPTTVETDKPENQIKTEILNYKQLFTIKGIPKEVNENHVDKAEIEKKYINTIGLGTEAFLAEPGKLLVGPDFPQALIKQSGGAIERINPVNQTVFENNGPSYFNLPEGGFVLATANRMTIRVKNAVIKLNGDYGHNWIFIVRGHYSDGKKDSDLNIQLEFSDYIPGHIQVMRYPGKPNGGFISEEQFKQIAQSSHTGETNCGADGCTKLSALMYDVNSGAVTVITQEGINGPWKKVWANFKTR